MAIALALAVLFLVGGPGQPSSGQAPANVAGTGTLSGGVYTINIDVSNLPAATTVGSYAVLVPFNGSNVSFVSASGGALAVPASDGSDQINIAQIALNTGNGTLTTLTFNDLSGTGASPGFSLAGIELKEPAPDNTDIPVNSTGTVTITSAGGDNAPVIGAIGNQTITPSGSTGALAFSITDENASTVSVTATSSNQSVIPNGNLSLAGSGTSRNITVTSGTTEGSSTITVTATDSANQTDTETFTVTVQASSTPGQALVAGSGTLSGGVYTIDINVSNLPAATIVGSYAVLIPFNGANVSFVGASGGALAVPASNGSDQINVAQAGLNLGNTTLTTLTFNDLSGSGANPGFSLIGIELKGPAPANTTIPVNSTGTVTIGGSPSDQPPSISAIPGLTLAPGATANGSFTVTDESPSTVTVSVGTSNSSIATATVGGSGSNRTVAVTAGSVGSATITLTATDAGGSTGTRSFTVTVSGGSNPGPGPGPGGGGNAAPNISAIGDRTVNPFGSTGPIAFTVSDESPISVVVTATSSNASVIQNADITLGGSGTNRSVTARAGGTTGAATITITARDSIGLTDVETFRVTVGSGAAGNQPPNIVGIGQRQLATNSTTGSIPFTVKDEDPSGVRITVVSSSNSAIVNRSDVTIAGIEENRTFSAKSGNTTGRVVITLRATDAQGLSGQQTVVLNVVRPVVTNPTATATPQPTVTATATEPPATPTPIFGGPVLTTTPGAGPPPDGDDGGLGGGTLLLLLLLLLAVLGTVGILVFAMRRSREGDEEERSTEIGEALPTPAVATTGTSATRGGDRRDEQVTAPVAAGTSSNDGADERNPASSEAPAEVASGTGTTMTADQTPVPQQPSAAPPVPQVPAQPAPQQPAPQQPAPQAPPTADMQPLAPQVGNGLTPQAPPAPQPTLPPAAGVYQAPQQQPVYQPQQQQPVYQPQQPQQPPVAYVPNGNGGQPAYQPQQPDVQQQPAYRPLPQQPAYQPLPQPAYQPGQQPSMYQPQPQAAYQQQPVYQQPQPMHQAPDAYQQPQPAYPQPAPEQQAAYPPPYVPGQYPPEQFAGGYPPAAQQPAGYAPPPTAYQQPGPAPQPVAPQPPAPPADQAEPQPPRQP